MKLIYYKELDDLKFSFRDLRKTSITKKIFTFDIYYTQNNTLKIPLLIQSPSLTITSNILHQNSYKNLLVTLKNLEYDKDIQQFYIFITKIEYLLIQELSKKYPIANDYKSYQILEESKQFDSNFHIFINTDKNITLCINIKNDITTVFNRFKEIYKNDAIFNENSILKKNTRAQFILELPSIWFELNDSNEIKRIGINWFGLQIKIVEQCSILKCLIDDEIACFPPPPPPPPLPPPNFGLALRFSGPKKIQPDDLLGGINSLKKVEPNTIISKNDKGFKPPTLDDILKTLKKMKENKS